MTEFSSDSELLSLTNTKLDTTLNKSIEEEWDWDDQDDE